MSRTRVGILFGGESGEHDVSLASASSLVRALDTERYEPVLLGITRDGRWLAVDSPEALSLHESPRARLVHDSSEQGSPLALSRAGSDGNAKLAGVSVDVVFPVLHGPRGEDGTVQGLFELANVAYVGSGVLGSAVSMDKAMMKAVFAAEGLPSVPYAVVTSTQWAIEAPAVVRRLEDHLAYPVFVKPCNMGSSVGISKARTADELHAAIVLALHHDRRVIVEQGIDAREIECAVLGNDEPMVSVPGEVVPHHDFYDYAAKYTDGLADLQIPAHLTPEQTETVRTLARRAFAAVDASGLARVDFFVDRDTGNVVLNEINTMPGFTATSMYPKLWEASGVPYAELVHRLLQLALDRHDGLAGRRRSG